MEVAEYLQLEGIQTD